MRTIYGHDELIASQSSAKMAYNGSSKVNMVDYIATLNTVPAEGDSRGEQDFLEDDLAMFTNANFFDFDLGQDADLQPTDYNVEGSGRREHAAAPAVVSDAADIKSLEYMNGGKL